MTEPTAPHASTIRSKPGLNGSAPPHRPAPAASRHRGPHARISGMRVALIAGVTAGTARISQFRQDMRRDRRKSSAG
jgi:hypothetical protein